MLGGRNVASIIATATCLAAIGGLTACAEEQPEPFLIGVPEKPVGDAPMPERYADAFARYLVRELNGEDRKGERQPVPADLRVRQLRTGEINVTFGCTGELLELLDRNRAMELRQELKKAHNGEDGSGENVDEKYLVYDELLSSLPQEVGATLPGVATPCSDTSLPQDAVVLYAKRVIGRDELRQLNSVATGTSMEMLGA
ncbi:hypothetical protein [Corynebacterium sp. ACRQJ]|uniref:hypothetical protein n=1 Tax=Corynebacterium sp. ACRQJ TaxID=2918189 RepID=UPI001EF4D962|nr:hypothetical protein [Corynebacterium sp. ACRQJ]MCG7267984.1 hypothetical protein [Corynebacterium sp. ACRQJ]